MIVAETTRRGNSCVPKVKKMISGQVRHRKDIIGGTTAEDAVVYADLTAALQRRSRAEGLQISATHLACVW